MSLISREGCRGFSAAKLLLVAILISAVSGPVIAAGEAFSLSIATSQESVSTGSDIQVTIKLTNETNREMTIVDMDQRCDFGVEVRDSNARSVPETEEKRQVNCTNLVAGKRIILKLKPGEYHEYIIYVNQLYDMARPDKYDVQVTRELPREIGKGQVKSNMIRIAVTE